VPLGEPGRTPLYVGLPSAWDSVDGDLVFPLFVGWLLFGGTLQTYMNISASGSGDGVSLFMVTLLRVMEGAPLLETLKER